jgi:hypothetical protein
MLYTYREDASLALWERQTWFVLVGSDREDLASSGRAQPSLWVVSPSELAGVVASQGRGTIGSRTLADLIDAGVVLGLDALFRHEQTNFRLPVGGSMPEDERPDRGQAWAAYHFGFNRPTPLGVALEGASLLH